MVGVKVSVPRESVSLMMFEDDRRAVPRVVVARPHDHLYEDHELDLAAAIAWCLKRAAGDERGSGLSIMHGASEGMVGAQPWITAFKPEHLSGLVIEPKVPTIPDPVVAAANDTFANPINSSTGLSHSSDRSTVTAGNTIDSCRVLGQTLWRSGAKWPHSVLHAPAVAWLACRPCPARQEYPPRHTYR